MSLVASAQEMICVSIMTDVLLKILKGNAFTPHVNVNQIEYPAVLLQQYGHSRAMPLSVLGVRYMTEYALLLFNFLTCCDDTQYISGQNGLCDTRKNKVCRLYNSSLGSR